MAFSSIGPSANLSQANDIHAIIQIRITSITAGFGDECDIYSKCFLINNSFYSDKVNSLP